MDLQTLVRVAKSYEDATGEHAQVDHRAPPHTHVDICGHLHAEVSELFNCIRRKKAEHDGMSYEDGIVDELEDILCIWALAVNLLAPEADTEAMMLKCAELLRQVAKKKKGADLMDALSIPVTMTIESDLPWEPSTTKVPGFEKKVLFEDARRGFAVYFRFQRVDQYPGFKLNGGAKYFVLEGALDLCGKSCPTGSFMVCEHGTEIAPRPTQVPCIVLCVYEKRKYRQ